MGAVADVQAYLEDNSLIGGSTDWASVRRLFHDAQDQMVVVSEDGGPPPEIAKASGIGDEALEDLGVLVSVRAAARDGDASYTKAKAILDLLHGLEGTALNGTTYLRISAMTGEPIFAGFDENTRPKHTIAFRLLRKV